MSSNIVRNDGPARTYSVNGKEYPSVTRVIGATADKRGLEIWRKKVGEEVAEYITSTARKIGTITHKMIEIKLGNGEFTDSYPLICQAHFENLSSELEKINNIHGLELMLYSEQLELAGTADCIAEYDGELAVIDFKTKRSPQRVGYVQDYMIQCTAYAIMYEELTGNHVSKVVIMTSSEDGSKCTFIDDVEVHKPRLMDRIIQYRKMHHD